MKKYVVLETVNMIPTVDNRPNTFLNQEDRVCEDGVFTEEIVSTQAAVEDKNGYRDLRTGRFISVAGKRISSAHVGTVFQFKDGTRRLVTRNLVDRVVRIVRDFTLTPSMTVVNVC